VIEDEPQKPTGPPPYADADFAIDLPKFAKLVKSGKKTSEDILKMVGSKVVPTEAQKAAIMALKKDVPVTFAQVADKLRAAEDADLLDVAADLIKAVTDTGQQQELNALYHARKVEFEEAQ